MRAIAGVLIFAMFVGGCDNRTPISNIGSTPLLEPFQGRWRFDLAKSEALMRSEGVPEAEIAATKSAAGMLADVLVVRDNVATIPGTPEGELLFFALHTHDRWICGKAWHHEDRHDPGDMQKCYVRLRIVDSDLHLSIRFENSPPSPNDPDIKNTPVTSGSPETCQVHSALSPLSLEVFTKVRAD